MNGENWMNSRSVFVTGGTGYLGQQLIHELLARGYQVRALARPGSEGRLPPNCVRILGDALDSATYHNHIELQKHLRQSADAGQVLIQNGLFTLTQLQQLKGVAPVIPLAPPGQVNLSWLRAFDAKISCPTRLVSG